MQEIPGTLVRGGISANITAKRLCMVNPRCSAQKQCESSELINTFLPQSTPAQWLKHRNNRQMTMTDPDPDLQQVLKVPKWIRLIRHG